MRNSLLLIFILFVYSELRPCTCGLDIDVRDFFESVKIMHQLQGELELCLAVHDSSEYETEYYERLGHFRLLDKFDSNLNLIEIGDTFKLRQDGAACFYSPNVSVGDTLFLILQEDSRGFRPDIIPKYGASVCLKSHLEIKDGMNNGLTIPEILEKIEDIYSGVEITNSKTEIKVYPNPTEINLNVESKTSLVKSYKIIDLQSKLIFESNVNLKSDFTIDISGFDSGIYFLIIHTENGIFKRKVIKI
jgi:Secretion system C-terminal sorting domain